MLDTEDDIVAIASPPGAAARGIVRLSGPRAAEIARGVFEPNPGQAWPLRSPAVLAGRVKLPSGQFFESQLLLWPTERSYTRQPSAEWHLLGSPPILQMVVESICQQGARLAAPGEFTLRAFLSGRLDLTQAEAVLAVIDAQSEQQLDVALQQLAGGLARPLSQLRQQLLQALAELEAGLDFVEEDIEFISSAQLQKQLSAAVETLETVMEQIRSRDSDRSTVRVVLMGLPNAGKSSLFNWLLEQPQAIVTDLAGTTTDYLSAELSLAGRSLELIDTAGVETGATSVAQQAQLQGSQQITQAQLRLICIAADDYGELQSRDPADAGQDARLSQLARILGSAKENDLLVITKSDLTPDLLIDDSLPVPTGSRVVTSVIQNQGRQELQQAIESTLDRSEPPESVVGATVQRAADSLRQSRRHLTEGLSALEAGWGDEIVAAEIREALAGLAQVVGEVYTDDILDIVFGKFCIGK